MDLIRDEKKTEWCEAIAKYKGNDYKVTGIKNDWIINLIDKSHAFYELPLLQQIETLQIKGTYIDIGANIGNHSIFFSNYCPCSKVVCIEPQLEIYDILNINANNYIKKDCELLNTAITDKEGYAELGDIDYNNVGMAMVLSVQDKGNIIALTLNNIFDTYKDIGLIKMDIEGWELRVVKSAIDRINKERPVVVTEFHTQKEYLECKKLFREIGYNVSGPWCATPTYIWIPADRKLPVIPKTEILNPKIAILITTYNRSEMLIKLLNNIKQYDNNVFLYVIDDFSNVYKDVKEYLIENYKDKYKYIRNTENKGREGYWQTITTLYQELKKDIDSYNYIIQVPDDILLIDDFFEKIITLFKGINCTPLNIFNDYNRFDKQGWNNEIVKEHDNYFSGKYIDMAFISDRELFDIIDYQIPNQDKWTNISNKSSGVGRYMTLKLAKSCKKIYQVKHSHIIHDNHVSVMHREHRVTTPLISNHVRKNIETLYTNLPFFRNTIKEKYKLFGAYNINTPTLFWGAYQRTKKVILNHNELGIIIWCGSDSIDLYKNETFVNRIKTMTNIFHIATSNIISKDLLFAGLKHTVIPLTPYTHDDIEPQMLGDKIYAYIPNKSNFYGHNIVEKLKKLTDYEIIICSYDTYSREKLINEIYPQCFVGLRLTVHDGIPTTGIELGLMGQKVITNVDMPNALKYNNIEDILKHINNEAKKIGTIQQEVSDDMRKFIDVGDDFLKLSNYNYTTMKPVTFAVPAFNKRNLTKDTTETHFVIPYRADGAVWKELTIAIRSIMKFYQGRYKVFVVGDKPLMHSQSIVHIPFAKLTGKGSKLRDGINKFNYICSLDFINDNFVLMYDDMLLAKPCNINVFRKIVAQNQVTNPRRYYFSDRPQRGWYNYFINTFNYLKSKNLPCYNYETHLPKMLNKANILRIINAHNLNTNSFLFHSIYFNSLHNKPEIILDNNSQFKCSLMQSKSIGYIKLHAKNKFFINYGNKGLNDEMKEFLENLVK